MYSLHWQQTNTCIFIVATITSVSVVGTANERYFRPSAGHIHQNGTSASAKICIDVGNSTCTKITVCDIVSSCILPFPTSLSPFSFYSPSSPSSSPFPSPVLCSTFKCYLHICWHSDSPKPSSATTVQITKDVTDEKIKSRLCTL